MVSRADIKAMYEGVKTGAVCALMTIAMSMAITRTYDFVSEKYASFKSSGLSPRGLPKRRLGEDDYD